MLRRFARIAAPIALVVAVASAGLAAAADEPTTEWAARHILVAYKGAQRAEATRSRDEAFALASKALAELKAPGADFEAISHAYSDDKASDGAGGFLGFFERGKMTPKFQDAVEKLKDGEVSGVVETPFGFHVIQRLARADADAIAQRTRSVIVAAMFPWKGVGRDPSVIRTKEMALDDATKTMEHLKAGGDFESIPPVYGPVPFKPGWQAEILPRGMMRPEFKALGDEAFAVAVGGVGKPVETPAGFIVLKRLPYYRMRVQHLVVLYKGCAADMPTISRSKDAARARAEVALKRYEADLSAWAQIVAEFSDEPEAGPRQGDLGTQEPGHMVAAFDAGIAALKVGEHTKVFETPFGFHVARRVP
jgi:parvulin-like peptidyl-prolyl isomerase